MINRFWLHPTMQIENSEMSKRGILPLARIIESMMELRPRQGNLRLVFRLFSLMRGLPGISLSRPQPHH